MTGGRGFIAVALVIFSRWHPLRAIVGALLFSGAVAFQLLLQASGVQISPFLLDTIPYILTLLVLIAWGGNRKQSAPASLGRVYHGHGISHAMHHTDRWRQQSHENASDATNCPTASCARHDMTGDRL